MPIRRFSLLINPFILLALLLSGCGSVTETAETQEAVLSTLTPTVVPPTLTPTAVPPRQLTICTGKEPDSLYPYGNLSSSARSILAAVYDGPVDTNSYGYQPVILQRLPSIENGDAQIFPVSVYVGDEVVDASGNPVTLVAGTKIRPKLCRSDSCAIEYDGKSQIEVDQMQVTFNLLPGLMWSDGEPLTAEDSVFSYQLNAAPATPGSKYLIERTQSYEAADEQTVQWWGKPGYIDPTYVTNFWTPYPKHLWSQYKAEELPEVELASRTPVGWGPYMFQEWVPDDHMKLVKNPYYFRADEGLPKIDILIFRFFTNPDAAVNALEAGQCDVLDPSIPLDGQVSRLRTSADEGNIQALFSISNVMERLDLGIWPASYDNGYLSNVDRPDFLSDKRTRQAIAMCLDRQKVVDTVLFGLTEVPNSFLPSEHPYYNASVPVYLFNSTAGRQLLEQAGWRDVDGDPSTPLQAWDVLNVRAGTSLVLNYYTSRAVQRMQVSQILADSLAQCGVGVNMQYLDFADLMAPGPEGPLFGRNFDLAEYAMGVVGMDPLCDWYAGSEIPNQSNHWVGVNISGYSNPAFDAACHAVRQSLPDEAEYASAYREVQAIFADELPVIPLYWRVNVAAARPDLCNFNLDPTSSSALWNIEIFDFGEDCGE